MDTLTTWSNTLWSSAGRYFKGGLPSLAGGAARPGNAGNPAPATTIKARSVVEAARSLIDSRKFLGGGGYEKWLAAIGVTDAPLTREGLATALSFFHERMPSLDRRKILSFLKAVDLHKQVTRVILSPPTILAAFRKCNEDPFKLFYTRVGTSLHSLGVNPLSDHPSYSREFRRYRVVRPVTALQSYCAPAEDTWSGVGVPFITPPYMASGGGQQLIVPDSFGVLELIQ